MNEQGMTQFRTEGEPAFPVTPSVENTENDNSASSSEGEQTNTDQTQSQEGDQTPADNGQQQDGGADDRGLADHPRWKEREENWTTRFNEQETRHVDEMAKITASIPEKIAEALKAAGVGASPDGGQTTSSEIPAWFGGDQEQWDSFSKWNNEQLAAAETRGADKAQTAITAKSEAEQKAITDATEYMTSEVAAIESDKEINPRGEKVDKNALLKFVLDNDLVDSKGRWNYKAGFKLMQGQKTAPAGTSKDRKQLAADTTSDNRGEVKPDPVTSSTDFSKPGARPW